MISVSKTRKQIEKLYKILKQQNIYTQQYKKSLKKLETATLEYIHALAYSNKIGYLEFFNLIDIINDNVSFLKEKVEK